MKTKATPHTPPTSHESLSTLLLFVLALDTRKATEMSLGWFRFLLIVSALLIGFPNTHRADMVVRRDSGATPADIQDTINLFQTDLGGVNNGVGGGPFATGFRSINWDTLSDAVSSPNIMPATFFNSTSPRGVVFATPGSGGFQVSADSDSPSHAPVRFGNIDPTYPDTFQAFSVERLFSASAANSSVVNVSFFVPSMPTVPAYVSGFGAVFSDVDLEDSTFIEYMDENTNTLAKVFVLASTNGGLSFLGVYFTAGERVAKVRITSGNAPLGPGITDDATTDLVVMDDFIYAEPQFVQGNVEASFNPDANNIVISTAMQADGKIVIGGRFSTVGGVTRNRIARLNADGTLDMSFNPDADSDVYCTAVQADGKIVIGGEFSTVAGVTRNGIARLNADGTLDTGFNPDANSFVYNTAVQADGKILIGGGFTTVGGVTRNRLARLNADGTLDTGFNPDANSFVLSTAMQADGKIVIGGQFSTVGGVARNRLARLNADGTLDTGFNPDVEGAVNSTAVQADGKIVLGGEFSTVGGVTRNHIARLNADGTLDTGFNPNVDSDVLTTAVQADGKILIGGGFTAVGGVTRNYIARLNADGTLDTGFDPNASSTVLSTAVQADGKILIGGGFTTVGGVVRNYIARLENDAATQSLTVPSNSRIKWLRGGASPEAQDVTFELSTDGGSTWTPLGAGTRISGGWELTGLSLHASGHIRARARTTGGIYTGSSGLVETLAAFSLGAPDLTSCAGYWRLDDGSGNVARDSSSNTNHGRLKDGAVFTSVGRVGGALNLDGVNDHVSVPDANALEFNARSFTVALWVKTTKAGPQALVEKKHSQTSGMFLFALNRDNLAATRGAFSVWTGSAWLDSNFKGVTNGQWHHLAVTFDGTRFRLYRDGQLDRAQVASANYAATTGPLYFGRFATANVGWFFRGMMDEIIKCDSALSEAEIAALAGVPQPVALALTVTSVNPNSGVAITVSPSDTNGMANGNTTFTRSYFSNTVVTLTAPAKAGGNNFMKWQRDGVDDSTNRTISVTIDANHTLAAVYAPPPAPTTRTLTVASMNPNSGVAITVSPAATNGMANGSTTFTRIYTNNAKVTLTAPATTGGKNFQKWQQNGADLTTNRTVMVTLTADLKLTVVYAAPLTRTLTVASMNPNSGVAITVSPAGTNGMANGNTPFTRIYTNNTKVTLTAPATAGGNNFQKWQQNGTDLTTNRTVMVTLTADLTLTAVYVAPPAPPTRTLTVASMNPNSGVNIAVSPNATNGQGNGTTLFTRVYTNNTLVTLTAPATASGNNFQKWQRDGADYSTSLTTNVTMNTNRTLTAVYQVPQMVDDAVGYWRLDDGSGTTARDSSSNGNHGMLFNGPVWSGTGKVGGSLTFDGVNDYVGVPDNDLLDFHGRSVTVALWVKTSKSGPQMLVEKQHSGFSGQFLFAINRDNAVPGGFSVWTGGTWIDSNFRGVTDGQWHHLAVTYDRASFRLYRDGQLDKTKASSANYVNTTLPLNFGRFATANQGWFFQGTMDDIRRYNRALSDAEVSAFASSPIGLASVRSITVPPPRITGISLLQSGQIHLQVSGSPGQTCRIQASTDLSEWSDIGTATVGLEGALEYIDMTGADLPARFYRVVTVSPSPGISDAESVSGK